MWKKQNAFRVFRYGQYAQRTFFWFSRSCGSLSGVRELLPPEVCSFLSSSKTMDWNLLEKALTGINNAARFCLTPYRSLHGEGFLLGFRPEKVTLWQKGRSFTFIKKKLSSASNGNKFPRMRSMRCCCLWKYGAVLEERKVETMKDLFIGKWKLKLTFLYLSFKMGFKYSRLICYVTNSKPCRRPFLLTRKNELLERLRAGEDEVRGTLIERNLRLVVYIARKFENTGVAVDDLVSIGTIGLIKAVNTFDPYKENKTGNLCLQMYRK